MLVSLNGVWSIFSLSVYERVLENFVFLSSLIIWWLFPWAIQFGLSFVGWFRITNSISLWYSLVCSDFLFLLYSDLVGCMFVQIYPVLLGCKISWHISFQSTLLWSFAFLQYHIKCHLSFAFLQYHIKVVLSSISFLFQSFLFSLGKSS